LDSSTKEKPELNLKEIVSSLRMLDEHEEEPRANLGRTSYPPPPQEECVNAEINFDDLPNLGPGDYVGNQYKSKYGLMFEASGDGAIEPFPRLFDSNNPSKRVGKTFCGDKDLGTPNRKCSGGGPGYGEDGEPGPDDKNPYQNCKRQDNVLIIQEDNRRNECGDIPDDNADGKLFLCLDVLVRCTEYSYGRVCACLEQVERLR